MLFNKPPTFYFGIGPFFSSADIDKVKRRHARGKADCELLENTLLFYGATGLRDHGKAGQVGYIPGMYLNVAGVVMTLFKNGTSQHIGGLLSTLKTFFDKVLLKLHGRRVSNKNKGKPRGGKSGVDEGERRDGDRKRLT